MTAQVHQFSKTAEEHLADLFEVLRDEELTAREHWQLHAESVMEPTGWNALWKLSVSCCTKFNVRYPCYASVLVTAVEFPEMAASVEVMAVQHKLITLPERVFDVPLEDLWPTIKQQETAIDVSSTAEFLDSYRWYRTVMWMPWDEERAVGALELRERASLLGAAGLLEGAAGAGAQLLSMSPAAAARVLELREEALHLHQQLQLLDPEAAECAEKGSGSGQQYLALVMRLQRVAHAWGELEPELLRPLALADVERAAPPRHDQQQQQQRALAVVWRGGDALALSAMCGEARAHMQAQGEARVHVARSVHDALEAGARSLLLCTDTERLPRAAIADANIHSNMNTVLEASRLRSCVVSLSSCVLSGVRLCGALASTLCEAVRGRVELRAVLLAGEAESARAAGVLVRAPTQLLLHQCVLADLYTGVLLLPGATMQMVSCRVSGCGVGVQLAGGARATLRDCGVHACSEHAVRIDLPPPTEPAPASPARSPARSPSSQVAPAPRAHRDLRALGLLLEGSSQLLEREVAVYDHNALLLR